MWSVTRLTNLLTGSWRARRRATDGLACAPTVVVATGTVSPVGDVLVIRHAQSITRVFNTYRNRIRPADRAWLALFIGVAAYEVAAKEGELMSHSYDRWLINHPVLTWGATLITAAHLLNILPDRVDPFQMGTRRG